MKNITLGCFAFILFCNPVFSQIYSNFEAKSLLREWGVSSYNMIEDAKTIIVSNGEIKGTGGLCIGLPIFEFITKDQVVILDGVSGSVTSEGTIIIEADYLFVSAIIYRAGLKKYLIAGQSLKDIVNFLLK